MGRDRELVLDYDTTPLVRIVLPVDRTGAERDVPKGGPLRIGFHRELPPEYAGDLADRLYWFPDDGDTMVGALSASSPGAAAVRAAVRLRNLGAGEIRFFGAQPGSRFAPVTRADLAGNGGAGERTIWSPVVDGDTIGIEVVLPSSDALARLLARRGDDLPHPHLAPVVRRLGEGGGLRQPDRRAVPRRRRARRLGRRRGDDRVRRLRNEPVFGDAAERRRRRLVRPLLLDRRALRGLAARGCHGVGFVVLPARRVRRRGPRRAPRSDLRRRRPAGHQCRPGRYPAAA